jgi:hypothetical protein
MPEYFIDLTPAHARIAEAELLLDCYEAASGPPHDNVVAMTAFLDAFLFCLASVHEFATPGTVATGALGIVVGLRNIAVHQSVLPLVSQPRLAKRPVTSDVTVDFSSGRDIWFSDFQVTKRSLIDLFDNASNNFARGRPQYSAASTAAQQIQTAHDANILLRDLMSDGLSDSINKTRYSRARLKKPYVTRPIVPPLTDDGFVDPERTASGDQGTYSAVPATRRP